MGEAATANVKRYLALYPVKTIVAEKIKTDRMKNTPKEHITARFNVNLPQTVLFKDRIKDGKNANNPDIPKKAESTDKRSEKKKYFGKYSLV